MITNITFCIITLILFFCMYLFNRYNKYLVNKLKLNEEEKSKIALKVISCDKENALLIKEQEKISNEISGLRKQLENQLRINKIFDSFILSGRGELPQASDFLQSITDEFTQKEFEDKTNLPNSICTFYLKKWIDELKIKKVVKKYKKINEDINDSFAQSSFDGSTTKIKKIDAGNWNLNSLTDFIFSNRITTEHFSKTDNIYVNSAITAFSNIEHKISKVVSWIQENKDAISKVKTQKKFNPNFILFDRDDELVYKNRALELFPYLKEELNQLKYVKYESSISYPNFIIEKFFLHPRIQNELKDIKNENLLFEFDEELKVMGYDFSLYVYDKNIGKDPARIRDDALKLIRSSGVYKSLIFLNDNKTKISSISPKSHMQRGVKFNFLEQKTEEGLEFETEGMNIKFVYFEEERSFVYRDWKQAKFALVVDDEPKIIGLYKQHEDPDFGGYGRKHLLDTSCITLLKVGSWMNVFKSLVDSYDNQIKYNINAKLETEAEKKLQELKDNFSIE